MRNLAIGVMALGLWLTSASPTQHDVGSTDTDANPERVLPSVVEIKKEVLPIAYKLNVKSYEELKAEWEEYRLKSEQERIKQWSKLEQEFKLKQKLKEKRLIARSEEKEKKTLKLEFTYYTPRCKGCSGITYTGFDVRNTVMYKGMYILATDPRVVPTYSILKFEHNGKQVLGIALDIGGGIKGYEVDMLVGTEKEAYKLGRQVKTVEIIRLGKK